MSKNNSKHRNWQKILNPIENEEDLRPFDPNEKSVNNNNKFFALKKFILGNYDIRFNVVAHEYDIRPKGQKKYRPLNFDDLVCVLLDKGFKTPESRLKSLIRSNYIPKFCPLRMYFSQLPIWTSDQPDHIDNLASYIKTDNQEFFKKHLKKMFVRMVACAIGIIPFNKHCFTLYGKQNDGKTTFLRFLCPPDLSNYIKEEIEFDSRDGRVALAQNFIINLEEVDKLNRTEAGKLKSFITSSTVKERIPYATQPTVFNRRASFVGTTNRHEFLADETGNVRWLVIKVLGIKHDNGGKNGYNHNINIDLVYAQALALLKNGFEFNLTKEDIIESEKNNKRYQLTTTEMELIHTYFRPGTKENHTALLTAADIIKKLRGVYPVNTNGNKIGRALTFLEFPIGQRKIKGLPSPIRGRYVLYKTDENGFLVSFDSTDLW